MCRADRPWHWCFEPGRKEYAGLCDLCWVRLSDRKRRRLRAKVADAFGDPPRQAYTLMPRSSRVWRILGAAVSGACGAATAMTVIRWLGW